MSSKYKNVTLAILATFAASAAQAQENLTSNAAPPWL